MSASARSRAHVVRTAAVIGAAALASAGCGSSGPAAAPTSPSSVAGATAAVIDEDFPDPDVVATPDGWFAFATGTSGLNIRVASSPDLQTWDVQRRDALPTLPSWASPGRTWAPDVSQRSDGTWVMYVTAQHTDSGRQCIGVATSTTADGTYEPAGDTPLVCPVEEGGAIDPSTFTDADGARYLLWKTDGNCCSLDTWIEIAPLSQDGLSLVGAPTQLVREDQGWEGDLVEAPTLVLHDGTYVLLYSANGYGGDEYAIGAAQAPSLLGPYTKHDGPVLSTTASDGTLRGPGGQDVVATDAGDVLVFHAWDELYTYRAVHQLPLSWDESGWPVADLTPAQH